MTDWTWALGLLNVTAMYLALHRRRAWAAGLSLLLQVPWTIYDLATRQYGFLLISLGSVATCAPLLWKKATREWTVITWNPRIGRDHLDGGAGAGDED